jgi:uncharacterized protein (DUF58 family)
MRILRDLYFTKRLAYALGLLCLLFIVSYWIEGFFFFAKSVFIFFLAYCSYEILLLFQQNAIEAERIVPSRLSNGDNNPIQITVSNFYSLSVKLEIIDELPFQFQKRDAAWKMNLMPQADDSISYFVKPYKRGQYNFGSLNILCSLLLQLFERRYRFNSGVRIPVYPSFIHLKRYELLAFGNIRRAGKVVVNKKLGHGMEFEQIKNYVQGDPQRWINWKATARRNDLMVNQYTDEFSKDIWCFVDKGRLMKMPFDDLSLLDYSINATLAVSHIAIKAGDKMGLITFSNKLSSVIAPSRRSTQMNRIMETLYAQRTHYKDSNYELLTAYIKNKIRRRSLVMLFTNFETMHSFRRQLKVMKRIAAMHVLVVLFFENTEITDLLHSDSDSLKKIYKKTLAEEMNRQKQLMVKELMAAGIYAVYVRPENLSLKTINKYLEIKSRGVL